MNNRLINTKVAGGGGCTDIVDNYDPFDGNGVALYQLNGNANDVSGNYNGTVVGSVSYEAGVFGQAVYSNNSSGAVITSSIPSTSVQTLSFWLNISATYSDEVFIGSYTPYRPASSSPAVFVNTGSAVVVALPSIPLNQWNNIVLTVNNGSLYYYLNGSFVGSYSSGINYIYWFNLLEGDTVVPNTHKLDQVRIFNTALTPLEVEALYTEELCICDGTVDTLQVLGDTSCIATYQLDGNANDLSGNYSGTPTNVSYGVGEFDLASVGQSNSSIILNNFPNRLLVNSVSFWFNRQSNESGSKFCFSNRKGLHTWIGFQDNLFVAKTFNGSTEISSTGYTNNIGQWYHACLVSSNASKSLYINGSLFASYSQDDYNNTTSTPEVSIYHYLSVGASSTAKLDQVRIFNKALNSAEVTTLYNETACDALACSGTTNTLDILGDGSCIATYPLDGSPADLSGNYNGVQTDVTYPQGYFDLAGSFNGSTSVVNLLPLGLTGNTTRTVSLWFNASSYPYAYNCVFASGADAAGQQFSIYVRNNGKIYVAFYDRDYETNLAPVSLNTWYHLVVSYNGGNIETATNIKIYVDNSELTSLNNLGTATGVANTANTNYKIGSNTDGNLDFAGEIDQVRIFNKALSAGEVTTLYNETPCN